MQALPSNNVLSKKRVSCRGDLTQHTACPENGITLYSLEHM
jgi:hypothetical protein